MSKDLVHWEELGDKLLPDDMGPMFSGSAVVECATQEFGTGAATAMTQVAADFLGVALERVRFVYGDTDLPNASAAVEHHVTTYGADS